MQLGPNITVKNVLQVYMCVYNFDFPYYLSKKATKANTLKQELISVSSCWDKCITFLYYKCPLVFLYVKPKST